MAFASALMADPDLPGVLVKLANTPTSRDVHGNEYEAMTPASWKQTAKDVPIAILASGLGYGLGATASHYLGEHLGKSIEASGKRPAWLRYTPMAMSAISGLGALGQSRVRELLRARREQANAKAYG